LHSVNNSRIHLSLADEKATSNFALKVAQILKPGMVIYLVGDLGAGKTTFVREVLYGLGYTGRVKSPTYTLLEPYHVAGLDLCHFDLYRMTSQDEWEAAGFNDELDGKNILFIEWPDKALNALPAPDIELIFEILLQGRNIEILGHSIVGNQCIQQL
jgi:tRNA threonylcarbamoyladenosine biosynthesis protein TsaE